MKYYLAPVEKDENVLLVCDEKLEVHSLITNTEEYNRLDSLIADTNREYFFAKRKIFAIESNKKALDKLSTEHTRKSKELTKLINKQKKLATTEYYYDKPTKYSHTQSNGTEIHESYGNVIVLPKDVAMQLVKDNEVYLFTKDKCKRIKPT